VTQPSVEALIATTAGDRGFYFWVTSAALMDPNNITTATELNDVEAAVRALGGPKQSRFNVPKSSSLRGCRTPLYEVIGNSGKGARSESP
jgi:hypothetical protein